MSSAETPATENVTWARTDGPELQHDWSRRYDLVDEPSAPVRHDVPGTVPVGAYAIYYHGRRWRRDETPLSDRIALELLVTGEWLRYAVAVERPRSYDLTVRVAAADGFGGGDVGLVVDGEPRYHVPFDSTGGWDRWIDLTVALELSAGEHDLELHVLEGGWKLAEIRLG